MGYKDPTFYRKFTPKKVWFPRFWNRLADVLIRFVEAMDRFVQRRLNV